MSRTKKLMNAVASSLLITGMLPTSAHPQPRLPKQVHKSTDADVNKAADAIFERLKSTTYEQGRTRDQILQDFPEMGAVLVDKALKQLVYEDRIRKYGDGAPDSPVRYFEYRESRGG